MARITGRVSLTSWLEVQPTGVQAAIAARGALRTIGGLGSAPPGEFGNLALICMRTAMLACLAPFGLSERLQSRALELGGQTSRLATDATLPEFMAVRATSSAALASLPAGTVIPSAALNPTRWTFSTGPAAHNATQAVAIVTNERDASFGRLIFGSASIDADLIEAKLSIVDLMNKPLWHPAQETGQDGTNSEQLFERFAIDANTWSFWRDWYQGFLDGKPLDWELQRQIALIPSKDWQRGAEHIALIINEIQARHEVRVRAEEVRALLAEELAPRHGIGHNQPPEPMDDEPLTAAELLETEAMLARVLDQVSQRVPDKAVVAGAAAWIQSKLWKATVWFAKKCNVAAEEFAKKIGSYAAAGVTAIALAGIPAALDGMAWLLAKLQAWLPFLH